MQLHSRSDTYRRVSRHTARIELNLAVCGYVDIEMFVFLRKFFRVSRGPAFRVIVISGRLGSYNRCCFVNIEIWVLPSLHPSSRNHLTARLVGNFAFMPLGMMGSGSTSGVNAAAPASAPQQPIATLGAQTLRPQASVFRDRIVCTAKQHVVVPT